MSAAERRSAAGRQKTHRRGLVRLATGAMLGLVLVSGCDRGPELPGGARSKAPAAAVAPLEVPGQSDEFQQMQLPPGQLTRTLPIGEAYAANDGPFYRSQCLRCHSVSGTSFAVAQWQESLHARAGVLCGACHGTHEATFVPRPGPDRCALCHVAQVEEFLASKHGPANAPGVRCVSCHEAHATDRGLARSVTVCLGCHLDSEHVQGFPGSRMGLILAEQPRDANGALRAADCVTCHMPEAARMAETGDFRNDRATLHDPAVTVARSPSDSTALARETIELLVPRCVTCHSERNARYRLENAASMILRWTPPGMTAEERRRPVSSLAPAVREVPR